MSLRSVIGDVLSGVADNGSEPVKIGGVYRATLPTLVDGQRGDAQLDSRGGLLAVLKASGSTGTVTARTASSDGVLGTSSGLDVIAYALLWNGASWDRARTPSVFKTLSAVVITTETTIWTPAAGKKFRLMGMLLTQGVATGAITLKDNTSGTTIAIIPAHTIAVAMPLILFGNGILSAAANNVLTATGASTETITGMVFGTEE